VIAADAPFVRAETRFRLDDLTDRPVVPLSDAAIFHGLDEESVRRLTLSAHCRTYNRNELICRPDEAPGGLFVIGSGSARAYRLSAKGQEITLDTLPPGSVFGLLFTDESARTKNFLEATADGTVVYQIPFPQVLEIMAAHPRVAVSALRVASHHLEDAQDRIEDLALYDVKTRLAHTLAKLGANRPDATVHATHRELAWMVGTRPEEVTKALRHLRAQALVTYQPRQSGIQLLDRRQLACYGEDAE
jgi:CRP/FNR family transcriptional regulator